VSNSFSDTPARMRVAEKITKSGNLSKNCFNVMANGSMDYGQNIMSAPMIISNLTDG